MMMKTLIFWIALLGLGWCESAGVAMVTKLSALSVRSQGKALQLFDTLAAGSEIQVPANADLTLSFLRGGLRVHCQGPLTLKVGADGLVRVGGQGKLVEQRPESRITHSQATAFNWDRMAGVRREDLAWLVDPALSEGKSKLRWEVPGDLDEVEVTIEQLPDYQRVLRQVYAASLGEAAVDLQPGQAYLLQLRGFSPRRTVEASEQRVRVLTAAELAEVAERERLARAPEARVELCSYLLQMGLRSRARQVAKGLLEDFPGQARLQELAAP